jgi:hypothetical protein
MTAKVSEVRNVNIPCALLNRKGRSRQVSSRFVHAPLLRKRNICIEIHTGFPAQSLQAVFDRTLERHRASALR